LSASSDGLGSVESEPFEVGDEVDRCEPGELCSTTLEFVGSSAAATGTAGPDGGRLFLSSSTFPEAAACSTPPGVSRLPETVNVGGIGLAGKRIVFTIDEATRKDSTDNGVSSYQVCVEPLGSIAAGDTLSFQDRYTGALVVGASNPELGGVTSGWLPDCRGGANAVGPPCVVSRIGTGDGGVTVTVDFGTRFRMG
jgi:hypothetical protein